MTNRLLAFARRQPLSPRVVRPNAVLNELLKMLRSLCKIAAHYVYRCCEDKMLAVTYRYVSFRGFRFEYKHTFH